MRRIKLPEKVELFFEPTCGGPDNPKRQRGDDFASKLVPALTLGVILNT